jgi:hypothetical protein
MSYLLQLMAQTGLDFGAPPPPEANAESAPPLIEIDEVLLPPPPPSAPSPRHEEPEYRGQTPVFHPEEKRAAPSTAPAAVFLPAEYRGQTPVWEPAIPEVVIEERVVERVREVEMERTAVAEPGVRTAERAPERSKERREAPVRPAAAPARAPTIVEVREWVAATPAPGEPEGQPQLAVETPRVILREPARHRHEAAPARIVPAVPVADRREAIEPAVQNIELSIGTVQVTVEGPGETPVARAPHAAPPNPHPAPTWSRLARRYVRA